MKKNLIVTTIATTFVFMASQAIAKTEGSYVGVDLLSVNSSHQYAQSNVIASNFDKFNNTATGFGLNYKYAFNANKIFFAPNAFYEKLGTKADSINKLGNTSLSVESRYGVKFDFGYDVSDNFALYVTGGLANVNYSVDWKIATGQKKSGGKIGGIIGLGANYYPHQNVAISLEYNFQKLDLATPDNGGINQAKTEISAVKIGAAYHF